MWAAQRGRAVFEGVPRVGRRCGCVRWGVKVKVGPGVEWGWRIWSERVVVAVVVAMVVLWS